MSQFQERLHVDELSMRVYDFVTGGGVKYWRSLGAQCFPDLKGGVKWTHAQ